MEKFGQKFEAIRPTAEDKEKGIRSPESKAEVPIEFQKEPIIETETQVSYLGVVLEKAENPKGAFVPDKEKYNDFINDQFSLELQKKIAISFAQGDPILIEGGTSIGKTTTVKKMCSDLGWEVHYANLNGATDVEDLMGRYIPNPHKIKPEDPEYIFADGKVTSGLRQEGDKIKVIILDEYNAAAPNISIRLHEVLDALEREGDVVLSEDASEVVKVNNGKTKVIALTNPPGKGYFGREPLDPAQLRRWVYQKEVTDLPESAFSHSTDALFRLAPTTGKISETSYLAMRQEVLSPEQIAEIPGISEILEKYKEFHKAAKELLKERKIAEDQPQLFTYDDRMEPKRMRNFILRFYNGDINEIFQTALKYYYANKLERDEDKKKLDELINHVQYVSKVESKRKILGQKEVERGEIRESKESLISISEAREILGKDFLGPEAVKNVFGVELETIPPIQFTKEDLERAKELNQILILQTDKMEDGKPMTLENLKNKFPKAHDGKKMWYDQDWYNKEDFFKNETPKAGWKFVSKDTIPNSTNKNYLEQTETVIQYLKEEVFKDKELPKEYQEAITEFESQKSNISKLIDSDWKSASDKLGNLQITRLTRENPSEVMYRLILENKENKDKLLPSKHTWTLGRGSDGEFVSVGGFDDGGAGVRGSRPDRRYDYLGVSFSRSL